MRNTTAGVSGPDPAEVSYTRDATNRIVRRDASTGDSTATVIYTYTSSGDTADITLDATQRLLTRTIPLPGGVLYTLHGGTTPSTWDHPSVRGDLCLTTDQAGHQSGPLRTYTPFGDPLTPTGTLDPDADPDTQPGQSDYGWLGQHQRPHDHAGTLNLIQMGARPYSPSLGRFLAVDPVEGGSANNYDYTNADPTNTTDLDGNWPRCSWCRRAWNWTANKVTSGAKAVGRGASWAGRTAWAGMKWAGRTGWAGMKWAWARRMPVLRFAWKVVKPMPILSLACFTYRSVKDTDNSFKDTMHDMWACVNSLNDFED